MQKHRPLRILRILISLVLTLSLFVPWSYSSGLFGFSGEMIGFVTLGLMVLVDPKILSLPVYFIINLWLGRDYLPLVISRFILAGGSFSSLLNGVVWTSGSYYVRWGYRLVLVTMGIEIIVELYHLSFWIRDELGQRQREHL